jgi:hypothetical protein
MRRSLALALAAAPCALLLACGGGDEEVIAATPEGVLAASQATLEAETASVEFSTTIDLSAMGVAGATGPVELTGEGLIDFAGRQSLIELDFGSLFAQLGDQVPAAAASMFEEPLRAIQDGTVTYVCGSLFTLLGGNECISIDLAEQLGTTATANLFSGGGANGEALLQILGGADSVEEVGEEDVVGVTTTHLRGTFTLRDALAQLPADQAATLEAQFEGMGITDEFVDDQQGFDVWIDGDGLVRQVRQTIDISGVTGGDGGEVVTEFRYVEFGVPVDIEIPTDATDISELEGLLGG